jgi:hypothetical protein
MAQQEPDIHALSHEDRGENEEADNHRECHAPRLFRTIPPKQESPGGPGYERPPPEAVVEGETDKEEGIEKVSDSHKCGVSETSQNKKTVTTLGACVHRLVNARTE